MKHILYLILLVIAGCSNPKIPEIIIEPQDSNTTSSFRALAVVDEQIAWASGSGGTILKTTNGGEDWLNVSMGIPDSIDFRDIEAFSDKEAIILSAGSPGLVYRTINGGESWQLSYRDDRPEIFFDAMGFWDDKNGIAFGDAIDGRLELIKTSDGGKSWTRLPADQSPEALAGEGGFAASGTCLITYGDSAVWIALGIPDSRVLYSSNRGETWKSFATPMAQSTGSAGIFSLGFNTPKYGLAIGGDYRNREANHKILSLTKDGGKTWELVANHNLNGQKSAITPVEDTPFWLCTGATGVNFSEDNGLTWSLVDSTGYYTIQMASKKQGWLTGANGRIGRVTLNY